MATVVYLLPVLSHQLYPTRYMDLKLNNQSLFVVLEH